MYYHNYTDILIWQLLLIKSNQFYRIVNTLFLIGQIFFTLGTKSKTC